ncbi:MAG: exonuclease [Desulfobacteraceae bacterium]|jgi:uncharacterized protein YprB with RNaseH-like and TPR domain|nr:MAG: exonuclease [Desulfobacteraceae bacterium]
MLKHTFCHLSHIGLKREKRLWDKAILTWEDLLTRLPFYGGFAKGLRADIETELNASIFHLEQQDPAYFAHRLPPAQAWRLFPEFKEKAAFVDIETTGLYNPDITTIALYDGKQIRHYVNGINLDDFVSDIRGFDLIITYNGKRFDVPIIESFFNITLPHAHIDLRYVLKPIGFSGGLKGCEKKAGIFRGELDGLDGSFAIRLWDAYYWHGRIEALHTLLAYNIADVVNLEKLMVIACNHHIETMHAFPMETIPDPPDQPLPFQPDIKLIQSLR